MNKEQVKMAIRDVKTRLEMFRLTGEGYHMDKAAKGLERLRAWKNAHDKSEVKRIIKHDQERELWTYQ